MQYNYVSVCMYFSFNPSVNFGSNIVVNRSNSVFFSFSFFHSPSETSTMATIQANPGNSQLQKMSSKQLRYKAQEFLASRRYANNLVDIISQWDVSLSFILIN